MTDSLKIPPPLEIKRWAEMIGDGYATPAARTLEGQMVAFANSVGPIPPTPPGPPVPSDWIVNTSKTFKQQFGKDFAQGVSISSLNIPTRYDETSPSLTDNTVLSFKFKVGIAGQAKYGHIGGVTGSTGGTPWYFISEGTPANLNMLVENGKFSYRAATAGTAYIAWMEEGATLPTGANPSPDKRVKLSPNKDYYFNITFYQLKKLIDNSIHENTCVRPVNAPASWACMAKLRGDVNQ